MRPTHFVLLGVLLLAGCKASPPSRLETRTITFAEHHFLIGNRSEKNPLPDNAVILSEGKEAFTHYCAACHGMDGHNTGVPFATRLSPPVPSLASGQVQEFTDGQLKWILDNGIWPTGMPASKGTLTNDELWSIVVFIRHLPAEGSQGVPEMYTK